MRPQRRAGAHTSDDLETRKRALLQAHEQITVDLRRAMAGLELSQRYQACRSRGAHCTRELSDVLNGGVAELQRALDGDAYGLHALVTPETEADLQALLGARVAESNDPVERMSALVMLHPTNGFLDRELPAPAYDELTQRSAAEVQMLLRRHRAAPVTDTRAIEQIAMAARSVEADVRIQRSAIEALGHASSADRLAEVTASVPPDQTQLLALRLALSRCGAACAASIDNLMSSGSEDARITAYQAIEVTAPADREILVGHVISNSPPAASLSAVELSERRESIPESL